MIEQNSTLAPFNLSDQFGKEHNLTQIPKLLICSFGKESGKLISDYFNEKGSDYLESNDIKLMADIAGVPSLLRKTIIVPKMKKYDFQILLSTDSEFSNNFPKKENSLTVLKLEGDKVAEILVVADEASLKEAIEG